LLRVNASLITTIGTEIKKDKASFIPSFRGAHAEAVEDKEAEIARPQFLEVSPDRKDADIHSVFAQANPSMQPRIINNELGPSSRQGSGDFFGNMIFSMPQQQSLFYTGQPLRQATPTTQTSFPIMFQQNPLQFISQQP